MPRHVEHYMNRPSGFITPRRVIGAQLLFAIYDSLVLGFSNRFVWKCPTRRLLAQYDDMASANHLEVGVGTGFFLDRCRFRTAPSRLVILDQNAYTLAHAAFRLRRYSAQAYQRSILEPLKLGDPGFDSVGINYVLHCLPGDIAGKAVVFEHLARVMNPNAVLFGSTTLYHGVEKNPLARLCLAAYNRLGIFCNLDDSLDGLKKMLAQYFSETRVEVIGCSGIFVCRG